MKKHWIVGIANADTGGVVLERVIGTEKQVTEYLTSLVREDRDESPEDFEYGTTDVGQVTKCGSYLNAYGVYYHFHIEYSARPEESCPIKNLND